MFSLLTCYTSVISISITTSIMHSVVSCPVDLWTKLIYTSLRVREEAATKQLGQISYCFSHDIILSSFQTARVTAARCNSIIIHDSRSKVSLLAGTAPAVMLTLWTLEAGLATTHCPKIFIAAACLVIPELLHINIQLHPHKDHTQLCDVGQCKQENTYQHQCYYQPLLPG